MTPRGVQVEMERLGTQKAVVTGHAAQDLRTSVRNDTRTGTYTHQRRPWVLHYVWLQTATPISLASCQPLVGYWEIVTQEGKGVDLLYSKANNRDNEVTRAVSCREIPVSSSKYTQKYESHGVRRLSHIRATACIEYI